MQTILWFTHRKSNFECFLKDFGKFSEMNWKILDFFGIFRNLSEDLGRGRSH